AAVMSAPAIPVQLARPGIAAFVEQDLHTLWVGRRRDVFRQPELQRESHVTVRQIGRSYELVPSPPCQSADDHQEDGREGTGNSPRPRRDRDARRRRTRRLLARRL